MLRRLFKSGFVRSIAVLSSGQMVAAAIPILAAPILGRLYLPSEYGVMAAYMSIASVLAAIGNWQYAQAIIVEGSDNNAEILLRLCMLTSTITALLAIFVVIGIVFYPSSSSEWQQARLWFLALPISVFMGGVSAAWAAMANRYKMYRAMATISVISVIPTVAISIGLGILEYGYVGLMMSYFFGQIFTFILWMFVISKRKKRRCSVGSLRLLTMVKKHKAFALFTTPTAFIGSFSMQSPIFVLGLMGAAEMIGLFSRARQLLSMPITLLGGSIGQVFQQRAATDYAVEKNCRELYQKTFFMLIGTGLLPAVLLALWAPDIFEIFLGSNWRGAGDVARILAPMLLLRFICTPLSSIFYVVGAQREDLIFTTFMAVLACIAVFLPMMFNWQSIWVVIGFSIAYASIYVLYIVRGFYHSK